VRGGNTATEAPRESPMSIAPVSSVSPVSLDSMISFKLIVGSKDDYPTIDDLLDNEVCGNQSIFKVSLNKDMVMPPGFDGIEYIAETILMGMAFEAGWCNDGIVSIFLIC
jgi:hypothetical protein